MALHKYKDWSGWWDGLRSKAMRAGAEAVATNLGALVGSNGIAAAVPQLHDFVLGWKAALFTTAFQFGVRVVLAAALYVQSKPDPDEKEFDSNPEAFTNPKPKDP